MTDLMPIADLHCDLLVYLQLKKGRTIYDDASRCSFPFLKKGNVKVQTLAFFSQTMHGSTHFFKKQKKIFQDLKEFKKTTSFSDVTLDELTVIPAIENASLLFEEHEPLDVGFKRLEDFLKDKNPILYLSMTWNDENRFGGGNLSTAGLKKDGEVLLDYLNNKNIAIDLSHTSDALAEGILNYIDKHNLNIRPIASHSNMRDVMKAARNLPKPFVEHIIKAKGIIGLNFVRKFVGEHFIDDFKRHVDYVLNLGGENSLCFGADFFCDLDTPSIKNQALSQLMPFFTPPFENASCYPLLIEKLKECYPQSLIQNLCFENFLQFTQKEVRP